MNLRDQVRNWIAGRLTRAAAFVHSGGEPPAVAPFLDVDRIARIFAMAEGGATEELFTLYRDMMIADSHSQSEFAKRKLAVIGKQISILPLNEEDGADVAAADFIRAQVEGCGNWLFGNGHLLDGTLYPVAVAEKVFAASGSGFALREIVPVPHRLLDFTSGALRIREVDERGFVKGSTVAPDPARYIVHRGHLLSAPDHFGGPMRSIVLWWLLSVMDRGWWARFLERFGAPFLVGKYDQADDASRRILERAFDFATKIGGLVISRETEVEIKQAASGDSGDGYERFLTICQREKSKLIIGQTLSAEAQATGMNSGQSSAHEAVRDDIREFDAMMLSGTLRQQLFAQLLEINRMPGRPPAIAFGGESAKEAGLTGTLLQSLSQAGLRVTDDGIPVLSKKLGIPVERSPAPAGPAVPFVVPFAVPGPAPELADLDRVAAAGATDLAAAFGGDLAPVARIIRESRTARECEERLRTFMAEWKPARSAAVLEQALTAYAANGVAMSRFPGLRV
jgi:phage gp29-like protein